MCFQLLKLKYDNPLSSFAFNCNLRHYNVGMGTRYRSIIELALAGELPRQG